MRNLATGALPVFERNAYTLATRAIFTPLYIMSYMRLGRGKRTTLSLRPPVHAR